MTMDVGRGGGPTSVRRGIITQAHMKYGNVVIVTGLSADRPKAGGPTCYAYFATDTGVLSIWNNSAWKSGTFS